MKQYRIIQAASRGYAVIPAVTL